MLGLEKPLHPLITIIKEWPEIDFGSMRMRSDLSLQETGRSATDHFHDCNIHRAQNLLLGTPNPVREIAYELGFEYSRHFTKLFKNKTGWNPTDLSDAEWTEWRDTEPQNLRVAHRWLDADLKNHPIRESSAAADLWAAKLRCMDQISARRTRRRDPSAWLSQGIWSCPARGKTRLKQSSLGNTVRPSSTAKGRPCGI